MFLIIDGGTTNLRVTLLSDERKPLDAIARDGGVRHTAVDGNNGRLKAALAECIDQLLARNGLDADDVKRCVAYGMITSDMGLLEIPHVPAPASAADLRDAMRAQRFPEIAPFPIHFIPGVRNFAGPVDLDNFGMMDMMRGEETEAVGLFKLLEPETSAMFILPGSHNKFVAMSAEGKILGCMTSISGELLDAMTHHTILADAVGGAFVSPEAYDAKMAMEGARACAQNGLGRAAFSGRILKTLGKRSHAEVQSYLLGAALALDVQAMEAFLPDQPEEIPMPDIVIPLHRNLGAALGVAPDMSAPREIVEPRIYVAPKAPVTVFTGDPAKSAQYIKDHLPETAGVICFSEFTGLFPGHIIHDLGPVGDKAEQARRVFDALREFDHESVAEIYAQCPDAAGLGLAIGNRLKKAAGFHVVEV